MRLLLDAGALLALERDDRVAWGLLEKGARAGMGAVTHGGVVAQVWRGGQGRQVRLARALHGVDVVALDDELGRQAGILLGRAGTSDAVDAALVAMAHPEDRILTTDAVDIQALVDVSGRRVEVVAV